MTEDTDAAVLLAVWQDVALAAELAERLATSALEANDDLNHGPDEAEVIASMAEHAAASAGEAAVRARAAADTERERASELRREATG